MAEKVLEALASLLEKELGGNVRSKHDLDSGFTLTTNFMHGPGGIFGQAGLEPDVFSTRVIPRGLLSVLPAYGTQDTNPIVPYLTGITADEGGTEKDAVCDTPIEAGDLKSCFMGAAFGRFERATEPIEINAIGRRVNRGEFYDLRVVNDPILVGDLVTPSGAAPANTDLNREILAGWIKLGAALQNLVGPKVFTGNPTNNSANGGYKEFVGLETLVGTGKTDVLSQASCPSLDSYILSFNYAKVEDNGSDIVEALTEMYRQVKHNAVRSNLDPVNFAFVMKEELFYALADIWPCAYATYRCTSNVVGDANVARVLVDGMAQRSMADAIRNGKYLLIDGIQVPVITDDYIPYLTNTTSASVASGCFASDIYLLPFTVMGGRPVLFFEYFDFDGGSVPGAAQAIQDARLGNEVWTSDGGRFMWTTSRTGWCFQHWVKIEPRLRLLTPHLAARLEDVVYCPIKNFRSGRPSDPYFVNGGRTYGDASFTPYAVTDVM